MSWIRKNKRIADWLYSQRVNTTFAVRFGENLEMTKYATISEGPYNDRKNYYETNFAEPYDIICRVSVRKDPSDDFSEQHSIAHNPEDSEVYMKRGVGRFEDIEGICPNALNVEYASDRQIVAECGECGTKTVIPMEDEPRISKGMEKNSNGETVTPCCYSTDWLTKLE